MSTSSLLSYAAQAAAPLALGGAQSPGRAPEQRAERGYPPGDKVANFSRAYDGLPGLLHLVPAARTFTRPQGVTHDNPDDRAHLLPPVYLASLVTVSPKLAAKARCLRRGQAARGK